MNKGLIISGIAAVLIGIGINEAFIKNDIKDFQLFEKAPMPAAEFTQSTISEKATYVESIKNDKIVISEQSIKVAFLLDTSGSMNGLIEQAKSQLWQILNQLSTATTENGQWPQIEIALYEYGKSDATNSIRKLSDLTKDMDFISEQLFALTTNGGNENCGEVIMTSLDELTWGEDEKDLKLIFIAGNEPFSQGPVNYVTAVKKANQREIYVNTIFCGDHERGYENHWARGAKLGGGEYMNIDHNTVTAYIPTPHDKKITKLNSKLNSTYVPYGKNGKEKAKNQKLQDKNASSYSQSNAAERAIFKSSVNYQANDWDLVDAYKKDPTILDNINDLPEAYQGMSKEELIAQIQMKSNERAQVQNEIRKHHVERIKYLKKNRNDDKNLSNSIRKSLEAQAKRKGYRLGE